MDICNYLIKLELSLHTSEVRKSRDKLDLLLSDNFMEIGVSGKIYNKEHIITGLLNETPYSINACEFELRILSENLHQLIYKTNTIKHAIRSSIWELEDDQWRMLFHQGTVIDGN